VAATKIKTKQLPVVTIVANPGLDTNLASEKAIRDALDAIPGGGDVVGPAGATDGHLAVFDTATGKLIKDGGPPAGGGDVYGDAAATDGHLALFDTDGYHIKDGGAPAGGGGAPDDADYVVETANATLTNEKVLGATVITTATKASQQAAAKAGRIFLPSDGFYLERDAGADWAPWGPIFPMTPPVSGNYSWVNQGGASIDTTKGGIYLLGPAGAGDNWRMLVKAAPSTPYTITAFVIPQVMAVNYAQVAIGWRQSSDGKLAFLIQSYGGASRIAVFKFTNPTNWNSNYLSDIGVNPYPYFLRIEDDGANRKCYWSSNGQFWTLLHSVGRTDFLTADQVVFGVDANNATWPAAALLLSWKEA
jgi:hypothetical protein